MLRKAIYPESSNLPSQYCKYFFRAEQSAGDVANAVSGAASAVKNNGFLDATLWANPGYATVGGAAGNFCTIDPATHDLTLNGLSLVVTLRVKKIAASLPASEQYFINSYQPGSLYGGIIISCKTTGAAQMYLNPPDNSVTIGLGTTAGVITDGTTATERSIVFILSRGGSNNNMYVGVDGVHNASVTEGVLPGKSLIGGRAMRLGVTQAGVALDAYGIAAFAAYQIPVDGSALKRDLIYDWAFRNPGSPMPDWVFA